MASALEASHEARAKVIAPEGEMLASRALTEASLVMAASWPALQLRYFQTLSTIATKKDLWSLSHAWRKVRALSTTFTHVGYSCSLGLFNIMIEVSADHQVCDCLVQAGTCAEPPG